MKSLMPDYKPVAFYNLSDFIMEIFFLNDLLGIQIL